MNLTSVSGLVGIAGQTNYWAAKAAIIGFTRSLAKEMAAWGIRQRRRARLRRHRHAAGFTAAQRTAAIERVPMRRFASADEIAELVGYLA